jgi:16S rRNA pseudouridine516 synthase
VSFVRSLRFLSHVSAMRLDRFIGHHTQQSKKAVRLLLVKGRVKVFGEVVMDGLLEVTEFCRVELDEVTLQYRKAFYMMLHKPAGYLSATSDPNLPTVMELIESQGEEKLHIGGRLDLDTTGLLLLTNDGNWSRRITEPGLKKPKVYLVDTTDPITPEYGELFERGVYLEYEDITTQSAQLEILGERQARLTIYEGRYRQVKRMFWRFRNQVTALHRESMGEIVLDPALAVGESRALTKEEVESV